METVELIRLACYIVDIIVCFILVGYFIREYIYKKLRASLAWAVGFTLFGFLIISLASYTTIAEVSKFQVMMAFIFAALAVSSLYYGASLVYFDEGSFFREKMTVALFVGVLVIGSIITYITPQGQLISTMGFWTTWIFFSVYVAIGTMFYSVASKLSKGDPRRKPIIMVALAWYIVSIWNNYVGLAWGENPAVEAGMFLFGSFGYVLLLYGMTTGKTTKK